MIDDHLQPWGSFMSNFVRGTDGEADATEPSVAAGRSSYVGWLLGDIRDKLAIRRFSLNFEGCLYSYGKSSTASNKGRN